MSEWTRKTIAECAANEPYSTQIGPFGKALTPEEYTLSGVPLLRGVNVNHGRFYDDGFVFISEETADRLYKYESYPGDVLLVHKGTLGQIGLMPHNRKYHRYIMGNSMLRVRCDETKLIPEYLYYWLCSREGQHYLFSRVSQVGVPQIQKPLATLREASLLVPPIDEQKSITRILETLDTKIENLRRQNETLETIAQTLFKHWFIDFEFPNDDGKPYKSSGGAMVASELGDIPAGWRVGVSGEIINLQGGFAFKSEDFQDVGNHGVIKIKNISDNIVDINKTDFISDSVASKINLKFKLSSEDILIAMTGAEVAKIGVVPKTKNSFFLNQRVGLFQEKINGGKLYIYYLFSREEYQKALRDRGSGSSAQPNISASDIEDITIIIPTLSIIKKFANIAGSLFIKKCENLFQIQTLTKTRDTLLPKLMSGQIRVKN